MFQQLVFKLRNKLSGYIICLFMTAVICSPILSISSPQTYSLSKNLSISNFSEPENQALAQGNEATEEYIIADGANFSLQADFELNEISPTDSSEYFDPDGFGIAEYTRDEIDIVNRSMIAESENLLFGTIDDEFDNDSIPVPPDLTFEEDNTLVYITADILNMRVLPTVKSDIIGTYYFGHSILRTGIGEDWDRVEDNNGNAGYMMSTYFSMTKPTPPPTPTPAPTRAPAKANTLGESIALEVQKYIGIRYRYAQQSPNTGFDCTGLSWYVFNRYGISTPRASSAYRNAGIIIPYSEIAPGDVISWNNGYSNSIDHVSIYIGNGRMVHATLSSGVTNHGVQQYRNWGYRIMYVHRFIKK